MPTLRPPTAVNEDSELKGGVKPLQGLQLVSDKHLRKLMQTVLGGKPLSLPKLPDKLEGATAMPCWETKEMMDRVGLVPEVVGRLTDINGDLGGLFDQYFGFQYLLTRGIAPTAYKELYLLESTPYVPRANSI